MVNIMIGNGEVVHRGFEIKPGLFIGPICRSSNKWILNSYEIKSRKVTCRGCLRLLKKGLLKSEST